MEQGEEGVEGAVWFAFETHATDLQNLHIVALSAKQWDQSQTSIIRLEASVCPPRVIIIISRSSSIHTYSNNST